MRPNWPLILITIALCSTTVPVAAADGCVVTAATCDVDVRGRLGVGDCTLSSNGTYYDRISFQASVGQVVAITLRPLSSTYTQPVVTLLPPPGDASKVPVVRGTRSATVWYDISSTGTWEVVVGTMNPFSTGDYVLHIDCYPDDAPTEPQNCVFQDILCGWTALWDLTSQSCRFAPPAQNVFAPFLIRGVAGDVLTFRVTSSAFTPLFGVYSDSGELLQSSTMSGSAAVTTFVVPRDDFYGIYVTSSGPQTAVGPFVIEANCAKSGCLFPWFTSQIASTAVAQGSRVTVSIPVDVVGSFTAELLDENDAVVASVTDSFTITTPQIDSERRFRVRVTTVCGEATSDAFAVSARTPRRRSVR